MFGVLNVEMQKMQLSELETSQVYAEAMWKLAFGLRTVHIVGQPVCFNLCWAIDPQPLDVLHNLISFEDVQLIAETF